MRKKNWILLLLIAIFVTLILWKPQVGWRTRSVLIRDFGDPSPEINLSDLVLENESLRAELAQFQDIKSQLPDYKEGGVVAMVYASYPFNLKNEVLLDAGYNQGVEEEGVVIAKEEVLLGRVEKVFKNTSIIKTVLDNRWRSSARIGKNGIEGLLVGGVKPKLTLVSRDVVVDIGDVVYSADAEFPYGLAIGEVLTVNLSKDKLFQEVELGLGYDLSKVRTVLILNKYNSNNEGE